MRFVLPIESGRVVSHRTGLGPLSFPSSVQQGDTDLLDDLLNEDDAGSMA